MMTSPTYGEVTRDQMYSIIDKYMSDPESQYEISVGCDSQSFKNSTKYVTVLAVRKMGNGGIFFYKIEWLDNLRNLRGKIYQEVTKSLELAQEVATYVNNYDGDNVVFSSVEVDIGKVGPTKEFIREIKGWIEATMDVTAEIKGDNMVIACAVANKISK